MIPAGPTDVVDPEDARATGRRQYWEAKHKSPDWAEDIHFGVFADRTRRDTRALEDGVKLNTVRLAQTLLDHASVYRLTSGAQVLDFACGAGDLLLHLAPTLPAMRGLGIDIAESAVAEAERRTARERAGSPDADWELAFKAGGVDQLQAVVDARPGAFDVVVCRDAFYLFSRAEQTEILALFRRALRPGGVAYIADLAVRSDCVLDVQVSLVDRQFGGEVVTWERQGATRRFSLPADLAAAGYRLLAEPDVDDGAVAQSYAAAAQLASSGAIKAAFTDLAAVARPDGEPSRIVYARFLFTPDVPAGPSPGDTFGVVLDSRSTTYPGRSGEVLRPGPWEFPRGALSLVIGRSGVGKTTMLRLLAAAARDRSTRWIGSVPTSCYWLDQAPALFETLSVQDNVALFARSSESHEAALLTVGFDANMRERLADHRLSGGERQRVALSQAIAARPELLLLDEPCAGVDKVRKRSFFEQLFQGIRDDNRDGSTRSVVCVDHDFLAVERYFDHVFEIIGGQLVEVGDRHARPT